MTPKDFTFKLTVPNDPEGATVVAVVATHAVQYTKLEGAAGAAFVDRVRAAAAQALKGESDKSTVVVFAAAQGQLTVTIGSLSVTQPLPA